MEVYCCIALFTLPKMAWYYLKITHDKLKMYIVNPSTGFGKSNRPNPAHCLFLQIKLLEQSCPFVYILPMAAFAPQCRVCSWNRDLMAQSLKYLLSSSLQKKFAYTCCRVTPLKTWEDIVHKPLAEIKHNHKKYSVKPWVVWLSRASSCTPKVGGFDSWSGHHGGGWRCQSMFSLSPSSSLSLFDQLKKNLSYSKRWMARI